MKSLTVFRCIAALWLVTLAVVVVVGCFTLMGLKLAWWAWCLMLLAVLWLAFFSLPVWAFLETELHHWARKE